MIGNSVVVPVIKRIAEKIKESNNLQNLYKIGVNNMKENALKPLLKYPGGKTSELEVIEKYLPKNFNNYIEPFVGGGAVFFYINNNYNFIND